jgi:predicted phosphodiesterase
MRLAVTSDLHYDRAGSLTPPDAIEALARQIARQRPELLILAGDLGHGVENFRRCVASFSGVAPRLAVLAGNHDVWRDPHLDLSSQRLLDEALPGVCAELGATWLETSVLRVGSVAVVGSLAWYDYSAIDAEQAHHAPQLPALKRLLNNDANWIDWPHSDPQVAARLGDALLRRIEDLDGDQEIHQIVVATHVPLLEEQMVRRPDNANWGVSNAFFGNLSLGRRVAAFPKVSLLVSGHTHFARDGVVPRPCGPLRHAVIGSDYGAPAFRVFDV